MCERVWGVSSVAPAGEKLFLPWGHHGFINDVQRPLKVQKGSKKSSLSNVLEKVLCVHFKYYNAWPCIS